MTKKPQAEDTRRHKKTTTQNKLWIKKNVSFFVLGLLKERSNNQKAAKFQRKTKAHLFQICLWGQLIFHL